MAPSLAQRTRFQETISSFDAANGEDPNKVVENDQPIAKELAYARNMTAWLEKLYPDASEALHLAARCQHIERWRISRSDYPRNRKGYLKWRQELKLFHADRAAEIMRDHEYDDDTINRVQKLVKKVNLKSDPEVQALEDVICLVFLQTQFPEFSQKHDDAKVISILQKTWGKMSPHGHAAAKTLDFPPESKCLIGKALGE